MKFELTILGCGGAIPTLERKPTAQYLNIQDRHFLIDCGEGTQIQLRKYNCKFSKIDHIFISHLHGDHFLGLFGYLSTLSLLGRTNCIYIYAPKDLKILLLSHHEIIGKKLNFDIKFIELNFTKSELIFEDSILEITSFPVFHSVPCCGFIFKEKPSKRRIIKEKIKELGLSIEAIKKLKNRENFAIDGSYIKYKDVTTTGHRSRSYAYCADTSFNNKIIPFVENVDLLYHEATFLETQLDKAVKTRHSTAAQAATIALNAHVKQLLIGHFSARYKKADEFIKEAKKVFKNTVACYDGYFHEIKK
ncbi:MAG: ribonuclease Z [Flavobacteriales bacterium]|nr:ribonuclease Z [Flavobacteriales bacterium]MDG1797375.1 ribonuclease Z [Flavobacteriales bacterium]